jgi:hypothetical protein
MKSNAKYWFNPTFTLYAKKSTENLHRFDRPQELPVAEAQVKYTGMEVVSDHLLRRFPSSVIIMVKVL